MRRGAVAEMIRFDVVHGYAGVFTEASIPGMGKKKSSSGSAFAFRVSDVFMVGG